jgi:hypothetical protein
MRTGTSPLGALARGVAAGVAGTAAMTAVQTAVALRRGSSLKDTVAPGPPDSWDEAPAPAQVGERVLRILFARRPSTERASVMTNTVHWAYGIGWGGVYGIVQGSLGTGAAAAGAAFSGVVLGAAYTVLPAMRIYDKPWEYSPSALATDAGYHLAYGLTVAGAYRLLDRSR